MLVALLRGADVNPAEGVTTLLHVRACRNLARKWHPDKNPSPEAVTMFRQIQTAYERLQAGAQGAQGPQVRDTPIKEPAPAPGIRSKGLGGGEQWLLLR